MASSKLGLFSRMWKSLKKSLVIYRTNDKFIGADEYGNKYFEREEDPVNNLKRQRKLVPINPDPTIIPKIPLEWKTWLQSRRVDPPTPEEIEQNRINMMQTLAKAAKLQERDMTQATEASSQPQLQDFAKRSFPVRSDLERTPGER